ncbi:glycosyltransferase [Aquimarina sp. 2201CG5-10]|uniref:glycosyltransferase n=1 Tax=Aquimarina callyspongiae TaxID=3098150 RepID=UPI002AB3B1D1|nr:glycosyltransferase [Aquimarina sp. 2201CG5-10]MDY8138685.1 glycosyltransferase [Aquimarina sp. 2201CG5-10]
MNKIKIAHILNSVGGVDVSLRLIIENIDPDKNDCFVIHGNKDTSKSFIDKKGDNIRDYKLPIQREISPIKDILSIIKTIKILKKEKPNLIHAHSAKGGIIAKTASLFYRTKVLHTPQAYSYLSARSRFKKSFFLMIEKFFKFKNSILLASSNSELQRGTKEIGYKKSNAELFNNSILPIQIENKELKFNSTWPKNYICTVGRPSYQKNIEMMIEVLKEVKKQVPDIHLVLMGVGEYNPNIGSVKKLIDEYDLEANVTLVEWIDRKEIFKIISTSKLYISTARYEGLPYSIIESLALSKACVVTNCDGNRDLVEDNYNGYVIDNNNAKEMADKVIKLYNNEELRKKMEENSKILFEEKFNMNNNIYKLEELYQKYSS